MVLPCAARSPWGQGSAGRSPGSGPDEADGVPVNYWEGSTATVKEQQELERRKREYREIHSQSAIEGILDLKVHVVPSKAYSQ